MERSADLASHALIKDWMQHTSELIEQDVALTIAEHFDCGLPLRAERFLERGNINLHTFLVVTERGEFLLQRLNTGVFGYPERVMTAMQQWVEVQRDECLARGVTDWEPITLVKTLDNQDYLDFSVAGERGVWRMMVRIPDCMSFKSLSELPSRAEQLAVAFQVGRGIALSAELTSSLPAKELKPSLPGYRDTQGYINQFQAVLSQSRDMDSVSELLPTSEELLTNTENLYLLDPKLGKSEAESRLTDPELVPFIELAKSSCAVYCELQDKVRAGELRLTAIHGDTKIENFLFDSGNLTVKSLIDLDTIMPYTWLADFGDCLRSLCNVAGEKETDFSKISVDVDVYQSVQAGFLSEAKTIPQNELDLMGYAVETITFELGLRFLTDYLRGDNYFMLGKGDPADLNKTRAMVQLTLLMRLVEARELLKA